jgi:U3 small nucleolar RNA-associated protein 21
VAKKAKHLQVSVASLRAPPVVDIHYSSARSRDWDDVVTCHAGEVVGRTWSVENKRKGNSTFADAENDGLKGVAKVRRSQSLPVRCLVERCAQCTCVSACGNFGLVGFSSGIVGLWNMQSGIRRRTFDTRDPARRPSAVTGIVCDSLNRRVVVGTQDGRLHVRADDLSPLWLF